MDQYIATIYIINLDGKDLYKIGVTKENIGIYLDNYRSWNPNLSITHNQQVCLGYQCEQVLHRSLDDVRYWPGTQREVFILNDDRLQDTVSLIQEWNARFAACVTPEEHRRTLNDFRDKYPTRTTFNLSSSTEEKNRDGLDEMLQTTYY